MDIDFPRLELVEIDLFKKLRALFEGGNHRAIKDLWKVFELAHIFKPSSCQMYLAMPIGEWVPSFL